MSNIIDFPKRNGEPISSTYHIHIEVDGKSHKVELTGDEMVFTTCPVCGKEFSMELYEFCAVMGNDGDLYSTMVHCESCSTKRK